MSTAFHPQTDGHWRAESQPEGYLRHYSSSQQDGWAELLPLGEHAYNRAASERAWAYLYFLQSPDTQ